MTVYSKTNAGRLLAYEQKPSVTVALRDLLRRVDGKTPYEQVIRQTGDAEMFEELCERKLVQISPEPWRNSLSSVAPTDATSHPVKGVENKPRSEDGSKVAIKSDAQTFPTPAKIEDIKIKMASFVKYHLPQHVQTALPEIQALSSEAQLLCMMSGYTNLISPTGTRGQKHVQELLLVLAGDE